LRRASSGRLLSELPFISCHGKRQGLIRLIPHHRFQRVDPAPPDPPGSAIEVMTSRSPPRETALPSHSLAEIEQWMCHCPGTMEIARKTGDFPPNHARQGKNNRPPSAVSGKNIPMPDRIYPFSQPKRTPKSEDCGVARSASKVTRVKMSRSRWDLRGAQLVKLESPYVVSCQGAQGMEAAAVK
jgi:hypothetical protein